MDVKNHFLRELKDQGLLVIKFMPGDLNDADIFTKNTTGPIFKRHIPNFVGIDEYMKTEPESRAKEGVRARFSRVSGST